MLNCKLKIDEFKSKVKIPPDVTIRQSGQSEQETETHDIFRNCVSHCIGYDFPDPGIAVQFNEQTIHCSY